MTGLIGEEVVLCAVVYICDFDIMISSEVNAHSLILVSMIFGPNQRLFLQGKGGAKNATLTPFRALFYRFYNSFMSFNVTIVCVCVFVCV